MKKGYLTIISCFLGAFLLANGQCGMPKVKLAGGVSTLGFGAAGIVSINPLFGVELGGSKGSLSHSRKVGSNPYEFKLKLESIQLLGHLHPTAGGFRLTGGFLYNNNKLTGTTAIPFGSTVTLNGIAQKIVGGLKTEISGRTVSPYLGLGWGYGYDHTGLGIAFDLGVVYHGKPQVKVSPLGLTAAITPLISSNIDAEKEKIEKEIKGYKWYPVVGIKLYYSF